MASIVTVTFNDGSTMSTALKPFDVTRYELHAARVGWPPVAEAPLLSNFYCAWTAFRREGHKVNPDFEAWLETTAEIKFSKDTPELDPKATPTP